MSLPKNNGSTYQVGLLNYLVLGSLVVLSGYVFLMARSFGDGSPSGGNVFPQLTSAIVCLTALLSLINRMRSATKTDDISEGQARLSWTPFIVAAYTLGFLILLPAIGYPLLSPMWMCAIMWVFGMRNPWVLAAVSIGLSALAWVLLARLAFAPPPAGLFEQFL